MAACVLARLRDGERAYERCRMLLTKCAFSNLLNGNPGFTSGRKLFQIDGNFGGTAAVMEMLLQSYNETIYVLPALPAAWSSGHLHGIRAKGGFEIDVDWESHNATRVVVRASRNRMCRIDMVGIANYTVTCDGEHAAFAKDGPQAISFEAKAGGAYNIVPEGLG